MTDTGRVTVKGFLSPGEQEDILLAIKDAELDTSGEIRVHVENHCPGDALDRAAYIFGKLGMHKTTLRNGVLFYLALKNRKFAIIGDQGINTKVPEGFWDQIRERMIVAFREEQFADGLAEGIRLAGEQLKKHFPHQADDVNELPDDISFGEK
ncbi:MAG: TPM domain-containing protein [Bacteroidales bacterium]|nr:TPM domain-containing protein [Bacteroidales bacterium]